MKLKAALLTIAALLAICLAASPSDAAVGVIVVPDDYATIQAAIDAAADGDRIYVRNGVYAENLEVNKSVTLVGEDIDKTRIVGNWSEGYLRPITVTHDAVSVRGFSLVDSWTGITLDKVSGCVVTGNKLLNNKYGIAFSAASGNTVAANLIESQKSGAYGIQLTRSSNNIIEANQITGLSEGIAVVDTLLSKNEVIHSGNNSILNNNIARIDDKAVWLTFTKENLLAGNTISDSEMGLALMWTDNNTVYQNNFVNNAVQVAGGEEPDYWSSGVRYSLCVWDNGKEGNYWSDYHGADANNNGIGDSPYKINEANIDKRPLTKPFATPAFVFPTQESFPSASPAEAVGDPSLPSAELTPAATIIVAAALVAVAVLSAAIYYKKHERRK